MGERKYVSKPWINWWDYEKIQKCTTTLLSLHKHNNTYTEACTCLPCPITLCFDTHSFMWDGSVSSSCLYQYDLHQPSGWERREKSQRPCAKHLQECREWAQGKQFMTGSYQPLKPSQRREQFICQEVKIFQWRGGNDSWKKKLPFLWSFQRVWSHAHGMKMQTWNWKQKLVVSLSLWSLPTTSPHSWTICQQILYIQYMWTCYGCLQIVLISLFQHHISLMYCTLSLTLSCLRRYAFSPSREVITVQHSVLTAFWQFVSASILSLLTGGCSASEQNSLGNMGSGEKNVLSRRIAPVYLLKKRVSSTNTEKLEPSFKQLP